MGTVLRDEITGLETRLDGHLRTTGLLPKGSRITVALSGGLDSVVLLDLLLSLKKTWLWEVSAAHFDHRMREGSGADATWVQRLCEERAVCWWVGSADEAPASEAEARELRYSFLEEARRELGSELLATAHQADDQAETVLFRLLRGSGLAGLGGIPDRRHPGIIRPLLPYWRSEIESHARSRCLAYLSDPTNLDTSFARNRIRNVLIPALEEKGYPDVREQLHRLSRLASRAAQAVGRATEKGLDDMVVEGSESRIVVAHKELLAYDTNVRAHLLRALVGRVGPYPGRVGTRVALEFINTGNSGRGIDLAGGVGIRREFDRIIIERRSTVIPLDDEVLSLSDRSGAGEVNLAGVRWQVTWGAGTLAGAEHGAAEVGYFAVSDLRFPLTVRSWQPGDRIQLPGGSRKLKKLFVDRQVGRGERRKLPLLVDRTGVLWVVGLVKADRAVALEGGEVLSVLLRRT